MNTIYTDIQSDGDNITLLADQLDMISELIPITESIKYNTDKLDFEKEFYCDNSIK